MSTVETTEPPVPDYTPDPVEAWRLEQLIRAGYPSHLAEIVAWSEADLHDACELVTAAGCDPSTAARILAPL